MRAPAPRAESDRGFTLVELIVYCALLAIVLPLVGTLLHRTLVTQRDVGAVTEASTTSQTVARSVGAGVRNASAISYTTPSSETELLVVRAQVGPAGTPSWMCQGWYYDGAHDVLYAKRVPAAGAASPAITAPTAAQLATWTELARGVTPPGGRVFTPTPSTDPTEVTLRFMTAAGERKQALISTSFTKRPQGETGSDPCFS